MLVPDLNRPHACRWSCLTLQYLLLRRVIDLINTPPEPSQPECAGPGDDDSESVVTVATVCCMWHVGTGHMPPAGKMSLMGTRADLHC